MTPAEIEAIRERNERHKALRFHLGADTWFPGRVQDGEYTGPGDDPPGYAGDREDDGSVQAVDPGDGETREVFARGYPPDVFAARWVAWERNADAAAEIDALLAELAVRAEAEEERLREAPVAWGEGQADG